MVDARLTLLGMCRLRRCALLALFSLLAGCSSSHVADAGRSDAGLLGDADGPTADASTAMPTTCDPEVGSAVGDACFCRGPAVLFDSVVYRRSMGVEVWDVSTPMAPFLAGRLDEPNTSEGGLAVTGGHLLSTGNVDPALRVYALDDPLRPRLMSTVPLPDASPVAIVAGEAFAVIVDEAGGERTGVIGVDLASFEAPRVAYRATIAGRLPSAAVDGERLFVMVKERDPAGTWLEERALRTGALVGRHLVDEQTDAYYAGLAVHRGRLLRTRGGGVEILDVDGAAPTRLARHEVGEPSAGSVSVHGNRAVVSGDGLVVLDLSDPARPRTLGRVGWPVGDARTIATDGEHAFVSGGAGLLRPVDLRCE